jgi:hypothetical protein
MLWLIIPFVSARICYCCSGGYAFADTVTSVKFTLTSFHVATSCLKSSCSPVLPNVSTFFTRNR